MIILYHRCRNHMNLATIARFRTNPYLDPITRDFVLRKNPKDTIYHDQTIAVASILTEYLYGEDISDPRYLQIINDMVAAKHESDYKEKGVIVDFLKVVLAILTLRQE